MNKKKVYPTWGKVDLKKLKPLVSDVVIVVDRPFKIFTRKALEWIDKKEKHSKYLEGNQYD